MLAPAPLANGAARRVGRLTCELRALRSELIKLVTVRSMTLGLAFCAFALIAFGAGFSQFASSGGGQDDNGPASGDSLTSSLGGSLLVQLIVGVIGVLVISSEYSSGMIRATLTAVPSRLAVLRAKVLVTVGAVLVVMTAAAVAAFLIGNTLYNGDGDTFSLTDATVLRAVLGTGIYMAGVGLIGLALGFLLRSAASAIGVLVTLQLVAPLMVQLIPGTSGEWASKLLPSNAADALMRVAPEPGQLALWPGLAVFVAWVVGILVAAGVLLVRRDA